MGKVRFCLSVLMVTLFSVCCFADGGGGGGSSIGRNESLAFKNSLRVFMDALGAPPANYEKGKETFQLPTEAYSDTENGGFYLSSAKASFMFKSGMTAEELEKEYQKKILDAQAKGDYEAISKYTEEITSRVMDMQNTESSKVSVEVNINTNPALDIDPEAVLFEKPGCIAVFSETWDGNTEVVIAFDPVSLKDTQSISVIDFNTHFETGHDPKTAVKCAYLKITGPDEIVKQWAGKTDIKKALAAIN